MLCKTRNHFILLMLHLFTQVLRGDYVLRVRVSSYENPSNFCAECNVCCDSIRATTCNGFRRCDNEFFFCVRPVFASLPLVQTIKDSVPERSLEARAEQLQCMQTPPPLRSGVDENGNNLDLSGTELLGLPNPMEFRVTASEWVGIGLYFDVIDVDSNTNDLVDALAISVPDNFRPDGQEFGPFHFSAGLFQRFSITLHIGVECQPGFIGDMCQSVCNTDPCQNDGTCLLNAAAAGGFECSCVGGYTGDTCEIEDDVCRGVECNDGTCVAVVVGGVICQCRAGYTGQFCDTRITATTTTMTTMATSTATETTATAATATAATATTTMNTPLTSGSTEAPDGSLNPVSRTMNEATTTDAPEGTTVVTNMPTSMADNPLLSSEDASSTRDGSNGGLVAGAVVGTLLFVGIIIIIIVILSVVWTRKRAIQKGNQEMGANGHSHTLDNPVYDTASLPDEKLEGMVRERDIDNPIYGLSNEYIENTTIYSVPDDAQFDSVYDNVI